MEEESFLETDVLTKPPIAILGFDKVKEALLSNLRKNQLHHAIILSGNKGIGKSRFALDFAKKIVGITTSDKIENNPDILLIQKDPAKKDITVDLIRQINDFLNLTSAFSGKRVIIIDAIDEMNNNSRNALLKALEEPSDNVFFLLINHNISKISPTIKSRCRIIKVNSPDFETFEKALRQSDEIFRSDEIKDLFEIFSGSIGLALEFHQNQGLELYDDLIASLKNENNEFIKKSTSKDFPWSISEQVIALYLISKIKELSKKMVNLSGFFVTSDKIQQLFLEVKNLNADKKLTLINTINLLKPYEQN